MSGDNFDASRGRRSNGKKFGEVHPLGVSYTPPIVDRGMQFGAGTFRKKDFYGASAATVENHRRRGEKI